MNIGSWDWNSDDFRLDMLGNGLFILEMPDIKLAFNKTHLIGFAQTGKPLGKGSSWVVKQNRWAEAGGEREQEENHLQALQGNRWELTKNKADVWDTRQLYAGERLETMEFFEALREAIENPPILLWLAAEQAKQSLDGL